MARARAIASFLDSMIEGEDKRRPLPAGRSDRPQQLKPAAEPVRQRQG